MSYIFLSLSDTDERVENAMDRPTKRRHEHDYCMYYTTPVHIYVQDASEACQLIQYLGRARFSWFFL